MNPKIKSSSLLLALGCSLQISCISHQKTIIQSHKKTPKFFTADSLSKSLDLPNRQTFFKDENLKSLIQDVLEHNPDLNIALQRIEISLAAFRASRAKLLPAVQGYGRASATQYSKYSMEGVGNYDTNLSQNIEEDQKIKTKPTPDFWLGLSSSWEIDFWGKLRQQKKSAQKKIIASTQGVNWIKSQLVAQTARMYYELVCLDIENEIIEKNILLQKSALEIVEAQKLGGRATELAVQQFKAQLLNTQSAQYELKQQIFEIENQINFLRGNYTGEIRRNNNIIFNNHFKDLNHIGIPTEMLLNRPDVAQSIAELEAAKADVLAAKAAFYPNITLSAYGAFNAFNSQLIFSKSSLVYQILGGLTAPIFQQNQLKAQFKISSAEQKAAFNNYEKTAITAYQEVVNQLKGIENYKEMISLKKDEVDALEKGVTISNDLYITGYASYLEIVTAQKSKIEAQLQLINLQRKRINCQIELYKSLGGGWQ